jgi:hypothetical protein
MNRIPIFRKGVWIHYEVPEAGTALWSQSLKHQVASVYASCITKGYSKEKSTVLAECFANKEIYGVTYNTSIEQCLKELLV